MRNQFANTLSKLASKNKKIFIVAADISPAGAMNEFQKKNPDRFINVGVAEQSMISICAGLAISKKKPFQFSVLKLVLFGAGLPCLDADGKKLSGLLFFRVAPKCTFGKVWLFNSTRRKNDRVSF